MPNTLPKSYWLILAAILVLAALLRTVAISKDSFWFDEAYSVHIASEPYTDLWTGESKDNGNPPLYWMALKSWMLLFGQSEIALRGFSALCSVLTVPLIAYLGALLFERRTAIVAAGLWAVSPWAVFLANEARVYALLQLLAVLATVFFVKWYRSGRISHLALTGITTFLLCHVHYFGFVIPVTHGIALLAMTLLHRGTGRRLGEWAIAMVVVCLAWAYWLPQLWDQISGREAEPVARTFLRVLATPLIMSFGRTLAWRDHHFLLLLLASLGAVATFGVFFMTGLVDKRRDVLALLLLAGWCLIPTAGPSLLTLVGKPMFQVRYAAIALPAFMLVSAHGITVLWRRRDLALPLIILSTLLTGISLGRYMTLPFKDGWRGAVKQVCANVSDGDTILIDPDHDIAPFEYYARQFDLPRDCGIYAVRDGLPGQSAVEAYDMRSHGDVKRTKLACSDLTKGTVWVLTRHPKANLTAAKYADFLKTCGLSEVGKWHFHNIEALRFKVERASSLLPDQHDLNP